MGRKKIGPSGVGGGVSTDAFELRPFCYYCDREFENTKTLVQHQRTKHFNCSECGLKFDTVTGLRVHMLNAYKRTMKEVPNAIPGRENPDIVVHGMEGLPKSILEDRTRKSLAEHKEREREKVVRASERGLVATTEPLAEPPPPPPSAPTMGEKEAPPAPPLPSISVPPPSLLPPPPPATPVLNALPPAATVPPPLGAAMSSSSAVAAGAAAAIAMTCGASLAADIPQQPVRMPPMPTLSPAVAKLLSGGSAVEAAALRASGESGSTIVPGHPGVTVPPALAGLHPIALQMLAVAGALPGSSVQRAAAPPMPASSLPAAFTVGFLRQHQMPWEAANGGGSGFVGLEPADKRPRLAAA